MMFQDRVLMVQYVEQLVIGPEEFWVPNYTGTYVRVFSRYA